MGKDGLETETRKEVEEFIADWMTENKVPGMSVAVVDNDSLRYAKGFGAKDLKDNSPATSDTLYGVASCTKSFTALAVLKLVERGELNLDDKITSFLPLDWGDDVSVHHLLTHSSGMPSLGVSEALIDRLIEMDERGVPLSGLDDLYVHLNGAKEEKAYDPGKEFYYFNSGYSLLGQIIEEISGKKYSRFVEEDIFEPLNMKNATFEYEEEDDVMTPYFVGEEGPEETPYPLREIENPAGGLLASVKELANHLIMNMNGGEFRGKQIVETDLLKKAHTGQIERENGRYGYGWGIKDFRDKKFIGHSGSIAVGGGYLGFTDDIGIAIGTNTSPGSSLEELSKRIITIVQGEDEKELTYFKRKERLDKLTGTYRSYRGIKEMEIEKECGLLKLTVDERLESEELILIPKSKEVEDYRFYYLDGKGEKNSVKFDVDEKEIDLYIGRWRLHKKE